MKAMRLHIALVVFIFDVNRVHIAAPYLAQRDEAIKHRAA